MTKTELEKLIAEQAALIASLQAQLAPAKAPAAVAPTGSTTRVGDVIYLCEVRAADAAGRKAQLERCKALAAAHGCCVQTGFPRQRKAS